MGATNDGYLIFKDHTIYVKKNPRLLSLSVRHHSYGLYITNSNNFLGGVYEHNGKADKSGFTTRLDQ